MNELMHYLYGDLQYPTCLETRGHKPYVTVYKDKLTCKFSGKRRYNEPGSVLSNACAPKDCVLYYFEVEILNADTPSNVVIGFSKGNHYHNRHPGSQGSSIGYHGESGNRSNGNGKCVPYGLPYGKNDIIGCGINYLDQSYFFTRNGKSQGKAGNLHYCDNYPVVGLEKKGDIVKFNFEGPFKFDIRKEYHNIIATEREEISKQVISNETINRIVYFYLLHRGYKKTLMSFKTETGVTNDETNTDSEQSAKECTVCEGEAGETTKSEDDCSADVSVTNSNIYISDSTIANLESTIDIRKEISQMIISGETSQALHILNTYYPNIDRTSYGYSLLLCQHFMEMLRDNKAQVAISWFRDNYDFELTRRKAYKDLVEETMAVLCRMDLENEALREDFYHVKRQKTANAINNLLLGEDSNKNGLKALVQFITLGRQLIREKCGRTGPKYTSSYVCHPFKGDA